MDTPADDQRLLSIVVPAYNEEASLSEIKARPLAVPEAGEIVIVDDCSTDETRAIADRHVVNARLTTASSTGAILDKSQMHSILSVNWGC